MTQDEQKATIRAKLQPMFAEAREKGLWFWCRYQDMWFTPDELDAEHDKGALVWAPENWRLRDPSEREAELKQAEREARKALRQHQEAIREERK